MIIRILILLLFAAPVYAQVRVVDGDTLDIGETRYRLEGIDAPEAGQTCQTPKGTWKCGKEATEALIALVSQANVICAPVTVDDFGRTIATCSADGRDLGAEMTQRGLAWAFRKYSDSYNAEETKAKIEGLGIWSAPNAPAWEYRAAKWEVAEQKTPEGCPIKGNISSSGKIYHTPWSRDYGRTRISLSKGERWFCSEAEAIRAGWRPPRTH